ncbi:hypothetical protein ACHAC9_02675 [Massilia sp. CMS3.1]|uniref:hypothetical protein n=1 Tax=Massilia sp. CMS3.1 TaxID=3373083 RepID=UPI003EE4E918
MSSIAIHDLAHSCELDTHAMSALRGGSGFGGAFGNGFNVNVNVNQQIGQFQQIGIEVLNNNGVIGAGFTGPDIDVAAALWAENKVLL